jgi:hypothetical protein
LLPLLLGRVLLRLLLLLGCRCRLRPLPCRELHLNVDLKVRRFEE